jgi:hypothetical protein
MIQRTWGFVATVRWSSPVKEAVHSASYKTVIMPAGRVIQISAGNRYD